MNVENDAGDWQAHDAPQGGVEYGVRFLVPHRNAGESAWVPDIFHAARMVVDTRGMAEVVQRHVGPWTRVTPSTKPEEPA